MSFHDLVQSLTVLDWGLLCIVLLSIIGGFLRGLIRSLFSLGGLIAGAILAGWYCGSVATMLSRWITSPMAARTVGFVLILVTVVLLAVLLGYLIRSAASLVGLGFADRMAGAGFGLLRGYLFVAAMLLPLAAAIPQSDAARKSVLLPYFLSGAHGISFVLPRDFKNQIATGIQHLKN